MTVKGRVGFVEEGRTFGRLQTSPMLLGVFQGLGPFRVQAYGERIEGTRQRVSGSRTWFRLKVYRALHMDLRVLGYAAWVQGLT